MARSSQFFVWLTVALVMGLGLSAFDPTPQAKVQDQSDQLGYSLVDTAKEAGLKFRNYFGGETSKRYILETTGSGVAFFDYDQDGWPDIFLVNGSRLEGFAPGQEPTNSLFHNNRDGTFTDVTSKAGLVHHGWGQGVCILR